MNDIFFLSLVNSDKVALIDIEDVNKVLKYNWRIDNAGYIVTTITTIKYYTRCFGLHRIITGLKHIDHKNRLKFDNRKCNLRKTNHSFNAANKIKLKRNGKASSIFKGVCWEINRNKWRASIVINKRKIHLGMFENEIDAAKAYNNAANKYFGEHSLLNTINETQT